MNLKKINPELQRALAENGFLEATELQHETFSAIKSGVDVVVQGSKGTGKTTALLLNIIHKLKQPFEESPRALIITTDKQQVLELSEQFEILNKYNKLRLFATHDKTNFDEDKNQISLGIDVLIGTPNKLNELFSSAGYNVNKLVVLAFDNLDEMLKNRHDAAILRLLTSIRKGQRLYFCSEITEKTELIAFAEDREPIFFEE